MFMALEPFEGLRVVDLFAGSGALGLEALSRGAAHVDFVEPAAPARRALEHNLATLGLTDRARVWRVALPRGLAALRAELAAADLVLADPPYGSHETRETLAVLGGAGRLRAGTRVVFEHHAKEAVPERAGCLARVRQRRYGETMVTTYLAAGDGPRSDEETPS
jgi:16S rRNA (guanine966-N2)-methyltransferase